MVAMRQIRELGRRIARQCRPRRIVLFGSHASGTAGPDSDVDLLVVVPHQGRPVDKSVEIRLKVNPEFPVDLIVRTPEAVRQRIKMGDVFLRDILKCGKVLYEAHDRRMGGEG